MKFVIIFTKNNILRFLPTIGYDFDDNRFYIGWLWWYVEIERVNETIDWD